MSEFKNMLKLKSDTKNYAAETVKKLRIVGKPFILFGAGDTGSIVIQYLRKYELEPICFCDNNPLKENTIVENVMVRSLEFIMNNLEDFLVVISCNAFNELQKQLINQGIDEKDILYIASDWVRYPEGHGSYIKEHIDDFEKAYMMLEDQRSRDVFIGVLNFKITHDLRFLNGLIDDVPYFDKDIVAISDDETFFDCGAYIGDTLLDFLKVTGGKYGEVACFEPNLDNIALLKTTIKKNKMKNVSVFPYACYDKKRTLLFSGNADSGRIMDNGNIMVDCNSIDNLCFEKYSKVDFIKMDIEGAERFALDGAKKIIQRDHPVLAICVYHKMDDFFVITQLIKELYSRYKLYFRQYEMSGDETVCIAVPE